jgi:hypothetical protein
MFDQAGVRTAGAQLLQLVSECRHAFTHALRGILLEIIEHVNGPP